MPPLQQTCRDGWAAGAAAEKQLESLMSGHLIECEFRGKGHGGQTLAVCRADGQDLGAELVRSGYAWAALDQSHDYVLAEGTAMSHFVGIHAHVCKMPLATLRATSQ